MAAFMGLPNSLVANLDCTGMAAIWATRRRKPGRGLRTGLIQRTVERFIGTAEQDCEGDCVAFAHFLLTCFLSSTPGVNLATLRAAILMTPPVCGLRPLRALRCETENVPKPTRVTRSPFFSASVTASIRVSMAAAALVLVMPVEAATFSTRSPLFMMAPQQVTKSGGNI